MPIIVRLTRALGHNLDSRMGIWAPTSFENDQALDFLLALEVVTEGNELVSELARKFTSYAEYDKKRISKTNTYVLTEPSMRADLVRAGCSEGDIEHLLSGMSTSFGKEILDSGASEAYEAIAAAEIVFAIASSDFSAVHEDGRFLMNIPCAVPSHVVCLGKQAIELILLNKPLLKENGGAWKRNTQRVLERISRHAT